MSSNSPTITNLRRQFVLENWDIFQEENEITKEVIQLVRDFCKYSPKTVDVDISQALRATVRDVILEKRKGKRFSKSVFTSETKCRRCGHMTVWAHWEESERETRAEFDKFASKRMLEPTEAWCEGCSKKSVQDYVSFGEKDYD